MKEMIGEQILDYRIDKLLGEGGMGTVYLASHRQSNRQVAIKELHSYLAVNTNLRERFKNEAAVMASMQHTNIVSLFEYVETGGSLYLVMEYVEGVSLDNYIQRTGKPIAEDKAIQLFLEILNAFAYAHNKGIVHRDVKPANIILTQDEHPKVLDFGIARIINESSAKVTRTGIRMGTVLYMSPEQVHGRQADVRSDIYSLGVLLYEMLTGQQPYDQEANSEFDIQTMIVNEPLPRLKKMCPGVSDNLQAIIDQATAKNPEARFQTCEAFKERILAEKERQQELILVQLMQEIAEKSHHQSVSENISTIKAANIQAKNKKLKIAFITLSLLIAAFCIYKFSMPGTFNLSAWLPAASEKVNAADASTPEQIDAPLSATPVKPGENNARVTGKRATNATAARREKAGMPTGNSALTALSGKTTLTKKDFQVFLSEYYRALQAKNPDQVQQYYAPPLIRFFSEYGVSSERLDELFEQAWRRTPENRYDVLWDTFRHYKDDKGNYIMDFYMNYQYRRAGKDGWQQQKLYTMIKMNKDLKIFYITGD